LANTCSAQLGKSHNITVNTIALGPVPTDTSRQYLVNPDGSPSEVHDTFVAQTRADSRVGTVEDIADAALLLASEKSRWITAQWISVSGGITGTM
jgi:NAD(P)-dependent dehydrogenase (short-subunit alcohol dehydrogenase family)